MVKVFPGIAQFSDCANLICTYEEGEGGGGSIDIWGGEGMKKKGAPATGWHFWGSEFFTITSSNLVRLKNL